MATKPPTKKRKSTSAKKLCSKVIRREGVKQNGQLMKGYRWKKGSNGVAVKVTPKTKPMRKSPTAKLTGSKALYRIETDYGMGRGFELTVHSKDLREARADLADYKKNQPKYKHRIVKNLLPAKKKSSLKKPATKKATTAKKHPGINQRTGRLKKGWKYVGGKPVKVTTRK